MLEFTRRISGTPARVTVKSKCRIDPCSNIGDENKVCGTIMCSPNFREGTLKERHVFLMVLRLSLPEISFRKDFVLLKFSTIYMTVGLRMRSRADWKIHMKLELVDIFHVLAVEALHIETEKCAYTKKSGRKQSDGMFHSRRKRLSLYSCSTWLPC